MKVTFEAEVPTVEFRCAACKSVVHVLDRSAGYSETPTTAEDIARAGIRLERPANWAFVVRKSCVVPEWGFCETCWPVVEDKLREVFGQ